MSAPFLDRLLGRRAKSPHLPNISDGNSPTSRRIAEYLIEALGTTMDGAPEGQSAGTLLEVLVAEHLDGVLSLLGPHDSYEVVQGRRKLSDFRQYRHLARLQQLIERDETGTLAASIGREYEIKPDVTVAVRPHEDDAPILHAAVSCKLTLRSDRAQNPRQESALLTRHRRGRAPHIVVVTAEPMPTRIASIARGTGDIDNVYHVALDELSDAVDEVGTSAQKDALHELVGQDRLRDYNELAPTIAL